jgi:hypothetical protein
VDAGALPSAPAPDPGLLDLKGQLFKRLTARAPVRLHPTIQVWETVFLYADRVPSCPDAHHARAVRRLARQILLELEPGIIQTSKA